MGKTFSTGLLTDGIAQDSSNNIGIGGAVNASYKLAVTGATSITTGSGTKAFSMNGASTGYQYMEMVNTGGSLNMGIASSAGAFWGSGGGGNYYSAIGTSNATDFVIGTNNAGRMIVTSSGNVTINGALETYAKLNVKPTNNQIYGGAAFYSTDGTETFLGIGNIGTAVGLESTYGATGSYVPMIFKTGGTERMRITSGGYTKMSNTGTYVSSTGNYHELRSSQTDEWTTFIQNTAASPYGVTIRYSSASPNDAGHEILYTADSSGQRATIRSNGGIANYQSNNVNLSDIRTKKDIIPLESYWDKFKAIEIVKFKYKNQSHDDFNIGVIAQQVEQVAPEFVDIDGWDSKLDEKNEEPLKSIYTEDLHHATIKVLQEAIAKIEQLESKVTALENR